MRKLLIATAVGVGMGIAMMAVAASPDQTSPEMRAYMNLDFGGKDSSLPRNFHYGLRLDQNSRLAARFGRDSLPAITQLVFNGRDGFEKAMVNGVPFATHVRQLNEDGSEGGGYNAWDWGLLTVGVVGLGFGIAEVAKTSESSDPKTTASSGTTPAPPGGTTPTPPATPAPPCVLPNVPPGCKFADVGQGGFELTVEDRQRQEWLDGGTGHMGDLSPAR